jgi:hypothetical protein
MGLKKYIAGSLLLILAVFGYIFSVEFGDYRVVFLDFVVVLPIAVWVIVPLMLLFILSTLHISFYGMKNYFRVQSFIKDVKALNNILSNKLLNEDSMVSFKNKEIRELSDIIKQLDISASNDSFRSSDKNLDNAVAQLLTIKNGKYVLDKELKLPKNNKLMVENLKNRVLVDNDFALDVIEKSSNYSFDIVKVAFIKVLENKSMTTIKKFIDKIDLDKDMTLALLKKDAQQQNEFSMTNGIILKLIKMSDWTNEELISIAKEYKVLMSPDQIIKLYEDIAAYNEDYTSSYLYILAQYEMIDDMRDILINSASNEYVPYKAIIDLKDAGKNTYSLDALCCK